MLALAVMVRLAGAGADLVAGGSWRRNAAYARESAIGGDQGFSLVCPDCVSRSDGGRERRIVGPLMYR